MIVRLVGAVTTPPLILPVTLAEAAAMTEPLMTWNKKAKRWFKKYLKKQYAVSPKELQAHSTYEGSVAQANDWWRKKQDEIDTANAVVPPKFVAKVEKLQSMYDYARANGEPDTAIIAFMLERAKLAVADRTSPSLFDPTLYMSPEQQAVWADRLKRAEKSKPVAGVTVHVNIEDFLTFKKSQVTLGELSLSRYDLLRLCLSDFEKWFGGHAPLAAINEDALTNYRAKLVKEIETAKISRAYARDRLDALRQFIRDRWEAHKMDRPRNLDSRKMAIGLGEIEVKTMTVDEVKTVIANATDRLKLAVLLMLNCGFTQKDISDLRPEEMDLEGGYIQRKRSKTKKVKTVPKVKYKLWGTTSQLLKTFAQMVGPRVLLNADGGTLITEKTKGGKRTRNDNIKSQWNRLFAKLKAPKAPPIKLLRKTGAAMLEAHDLYGRYAQYYLRQAPRSVADRHYIQPSQEQFDKALTWLGTQFSIS